MQITELVRGTSKDYSPAPEKQVKWQNRLFSKAGRAYYTGRNFNTQSNAESAMQHDLALMKSSGRPLAMPQGIFTLADYSWHMQIPILQD